MRIFRKLHSGEDEFMAYKTHQRKLLANFFESNPHGSFSVKEIHAALFESGISISAIYRNLAAMKADGTLRCRITDASHEVYYQFAASSSCADTIHLSCTDCGKTFHMPNSTSSLLAKDLENNEGFHINKSQTILYGKCKTCAAK